MNLEETKEFVRKNNIEAEFIEHSESGLTSREAASATGIDISRIIKVLCFADKMGNKCFVIAQGNKRIDTKKIPGLKKPRIADKEELKEWFNAEPGAIPPVGLPREIPKYIDIGIRNLPFVVGSAGSRFVGLKIKPQDIIGQPNAMVIDLAE